MSVEGSIHAKGSPPPRSRSLPLIDPTAITRAKERAALVSVAVKVALTVAKFVAATLSGSLALASEAGNNLGDVAVTLLSFYSIRMASKPADDDHPFGHGKVESLSAMIQTGFLFALAVFILIEAVKRLVWGGTDVEPGPFAFGVLLVSIVVDAARWFSLNKIAKATRSAALAADALNFLTDIVASALALAGLLAAYAGFRSGDAIAAAAVALFVGVAGFRLGRATVDTLIDAAPKGLSGPLRATVAHVSGVIGVGALRLRPMGDIVTGEVTILVSRTLSVERVAAIKAEVARAVAIAHDGAEVTVTDEPVALDDESVVERTLLIANRRRVPIHHVTVQTLGSRTSVSFDAEIDGRLPLGQAHEIVSGLEGAIGAELGGGFEVESHIEPLEVLERAGRDCDEGDRLRVERALRDSAPATGALTDVHHVRVRHTSDGLIVNYHCIVDPTLSVDQVHAAVDDLDRSVRLACTDVARIVGHAEPPRARDDP